MMMKNRYVNVTQEDMEAALEVGPPGHFKMIQIAGTIELVYQRVYYGEGESLYAVRVYTGINPDGNSRKRGADAIRVEVYWKPNRNPETRPVRVGGSQRINRVPGWRKRLQERIANWESMLGPNCPKCGQPMVARKAKSGVYKGEEFYGCTRYPDCNATVFK